MSDFKKILLIICDQFRYPQHWGSQDGEKSFTPSIDKLRENGVEFLNTYIASAACNASRACIYTGKYGQETGVTSTSGFGNEGTGNPEDEGKRHGGQSWLGYHPYDPQCSLPHDTVIKTLGTHFRDADYRAIYKGKWHLSEVEGGWPNKAYDAEGLKAYGFEGWNPPEGHGNSALRMGMGADTSYVQDVVNTLYELKDTNHDWFMAANLINPHDVGFFGDWPLTIPDMGVKVPTNHGDDLANKAAVQKLGKWYWNGSTFGYREDEPNRREWKSYANFYAYLAQIADFNVGIILQALEDTGQKDDTLVVFLSDHGEMGGSHEMTQKWYQSYEETIHVPLIFSNPKFNGQHQTECMASLIDIAPTLLSQAGIERPDPESKDALRGRDLSPVLASPSDQTEFVQDAVLFVTNDDIVGSVFEDWEIPDFAHNLRGRRPGTEKFVEFLKEKLADELDCPRFLRTVRTQGGWNLTQYTKRKHQHGHHADDEYEMYNLNVDEGQMNNLATEENLADPANARRFDALKERLDGLLEEKYFHRSMRPRERPSDEEETEE